MKTSFVSLIVFAFLGTSAMAGDVNRTVAALVGGSPAPISKNFTPRPGVIVATQTCTTTCNGTSYSCSGEQSCDCACNRQPVCECK